ncbi:TetR family transcriptional regulator [Streptomyces xanthochromogenes]|uniref:TetR family transcriptional regulator n=1 Tax=Streptomyces xanthochromogenes TaxID=67384 RepID=A0ABQ2ZTL9_9ACTN|nr:MULTISPECIES: TetR family transcriptional regulator [Streptomyces]MYV95460.1 TetR family transcriptional regulator [Streptomyces sp. SID1034]GGY23941.1 TetR family transcriptional regulator [Streptomyces xanthochromogenes]GHB24465.1 TetR family transcriptional regulator [Streptomyces xanthochromogenes]
MAMSTEPLTAERILVATEEVLRRHGPAKATVVDVARQLGVSHGSVYRHFRTKAALREAVTERWLNRSTDLLRGIAARQDLESGVVLRLWLSELFLAKMAKAGDDPELFQTYEVLLRENSRVVEEHIGELVGQLTAIIQLGVERGEFRISDTPGSAARAVFDATGRFHDPVYAAEWSRPSIRDDFGAVADLILNGLRR